MEANGSKGTEQHVKDHSAIMVNLDKPEGRSKPHFHLSLRLTGEFMKFSAIAVPYF